MYEPFDENTSESTRSANKGVWKPESEHKSGSMFRQITGTLADGMNRAAATLHEKTGNMQSNEMSDLGRKTADWLERSATYVSDLEPAQIRTDLETQVRKSPGKSLLIAGAAGLLLGAFLRQRR